MRVNRHRPHVFVLPEDDANRQLANGFALYPFVSDQIHILQEAGGWCSVLDSFTRNHIREMERYSHRLMVLLIDFDRDKTRLDEVKAKIPESLNERVFVLGVSSEPEDIRKDLRKSYEDIGLELAKDCREGTNSVWGHALLRNNLSELNRLQRHLGPILFKVAAK